MSDTPLSTEASGADAPAWEALARFLAGESAPDEARAVAAWLAEHPEDAAMVRALDVAATAAAVSDPAAAPVDVEAALARVRQRRDATPGAEVRPLRPRGAALASARRAWRLGGLAAAAAIALAVALGRDGAAPDARSGARALTTAVGVRDSLRLPDGSRVVLAPGSSLRVADGYGDGAREVVLHGAGWFAVRHDEVRPFRVRAGGAVVEDLGTEFTVRTDGAGARAVAVSVLEGSVALRADGDEGASAQPPVVLRAGDRGAVDSAGRVRADRGAAVADDAAWTRGRLVYREAPLSVVQADLRRWYGVELRLGDPGLAGQRLTATFEGDPVSQVLEVIALAVGAEVTRDGNVATLRRPPGAR